MTRPARFPTAPPPTAAPFRGGLRAIGPDLADADREVPTGIYRAPGQCGFTGGVARRLGVGGTTPGKEQGAVNPAVGRIARKSCAAAGLEPEPNDAGGDRLWSALFEGFRHPDGRFAWRLHRGLAAAMEAAGRVDPADERPEPLPDEWPDAPARPSGTGVLEGTVRQITVNAYERSPANRRAGLAVRGTACAACGFDFGRSYGPPGEGFIHVHHLAPPAAAAGALEVDPAADLVPVCPNCHAMPHRGPGRQAEPRTVDELRALLARDAGRGAS